MSKPVSIFLKPVSWLFVLGLMFSVNTYAQDDAESKEKEEETQTEEVQKTAAPAKKKFEKVQVTGSLIRRADFEGPSPVQVIDRKSMDESSYNSVADYVRDLPISSFGSNKEKSGSTAAGVSGINLRGLGEANTLVLMNGARLPIDGNAGYVNMNLVPEIAIDSTEILKDGASATYGSDAIGGVVALKTRKDFTGVEASLRQTITEEKGGERTDIGIIGGKQFGAFGPFTGGSITAAAQYRFNKKIFDADRSWSAPDDQGIVGWSQIGTVPGYTDSAGNATFIQADCDAAGFISIEDGADRYCGFPFGTRSTSLPEIQQLSSYVNAELEIGSRNKISMTALATRQEISWQYAPSPGGPWVNFEIPAGQAGTIYQGGPLPGTTGSDPVPFTYRTEELGNRLTETSNNSYYVYSEFAREFGETWQWKTSASYSTTDKNSQSPTGYALVQGLIDAVGNGFNPFDPNRDPAALTAAGYQPFQKTTSNSVVADSQVSGELMTIGESVVISGALGMQYIHSEFRDRVDTETAAGTVFGSAGSNGFGQRDAGAAYMELGMTYGKMIEVQLAGRYDEYSDFGETFNPKVGVKFRPLDSLMFRASYGTAFKAPSLLDLYRSDSIGNPRFIDTVKCNLDKAAGNPNTSACRESQHNVLSGGNADLDAEESTTYGAGVVYEPIRGLAIGADYWLIDQSSVVGIDYEEMTKAEAAGVNLAQYGVTVQRDGNQNIVQVTAPTLNLSSLKQSGVDFNISYTFDTSIGKFRIADAHSITFQVDQTGFPEVAPRDYLDDYGNPEWRNTASLTFAPNRNHSFGLNYMQIAGQKTVDRINRISSYGELELTYNTVLPWWKGTTLTAGVRNILGETPPYDPNGGATPFNEELYSQLQRYGYINLRHAF